MLLSGSKVHSNEIFGNQKVIAYILVSRFRIGAPVFFGLGVLRGLKWESRKFVYNAGHCTGSRHETQELSSTAADAMKRQTVNSSSKGSSPSSEES